MYEAETENVTDQDYRDVDPDESEGDPGDQRLKEHFAWHVLWKRPLAPSSQGREREGFGSDGYAEPSSPDGSNTKERMDPLTEAARQAEKSSSNGGTSGTKGEDQDGEPDRLPSLTDKLFGVTVDLLFCAGFTIPENMKGPDGQGDKINVGDGSRTPDSISVMN